MTAPRNAEITFGQTQAIARVLADALALVHLEHGWSKSATTMHNALAQLRSVMAAAHGVIPIQIVPDGGIKPPSSGN